MAVKMRGVSQVLKVTRPTATMFKRDNRQVPVRSAVQVGANNRSASAGSKVPASSRKA